MNKYIKVLSLLLALTSSVYLPGAIAASTTSSTDMLLTIAETDPVLVDRLNDIALNDEKLLKQLFKMADSDPVKLEELLNLAESDPVIFWKIAAIYNAQLIESAEKTEELKVEEEPMYSTFGTISDDDVIRN